MSTDASQKSLVTPPRVGYSVIEHHNSNNSRKRGLVGWVIGKLGKPEFRNKTTYQVVKSADGAPLPYQPLLVKRNKYAPHVGAKQRNRILLLGV